MKLKKVIYTLLLYCTSITSIYSQMRGRADESEWRDPEDSSSDSWTYTLITVAILFGIPWGISKLIEYSDSQKKKKK